MSNELLITVIWTERNCADAPIAKMKKTWIKLFYGIKYAIDTSDHMNRDVILIKCKKSQYQQMMKKCQVK